MTCWIGMCVGAMLLVSRAAPVPAAAAREKPNAAEAPKVNKGDSSSRAGCQAGLHDLHQLQPGHARAKRCSSYPDHDRVSDPGSKEHPVYTGFFFYQCLQFDSTGRYLLAMRVYFDYRPIRPTDRAEIGFIDLKEQYKWTRIGETTAWNWQQGARLQWRPASDEIVWNDRSDDGTTFVSRR